MTDINPDLAAGVRQGRADMIGTVHRLQDVMKAARALIAAHDPPLIDTEMDGTVCFFCQGAEGHAPVCEWHKLICVIDSRALPDTPA